MPNPFARAMTVGGNQNAGAILYRLAYWMRKTKFKIDGEACVVMSRERWMGETALSLDAYKRGLSSLKQDELIIVKHGFHRGIRLAHIRLSERAIRLLSPEGKSATMHQGEEQICAEEGGKSAPAYTTYISEVDKGDNLVSCVQSNAEVDTEAQGYSGKTAIPKQGGNHNSGKSSKLGIEALAQATSKPHPAESVHMGKLQEAWVDAVSAATDAYVAPLTSKQKGQLKHFVAACPPGTAEKVLRYAVDQWLNFATKVQVEAGWKTVAMSPSLDFLLKHAGIAVNLWLPKIPAGGQGAGQGSETRSAINFTVLETRPGSPDEDRGRAEGGSHCHVGRRLIKLHIPYDCEPSIVEVVRHRSHWQSQHRTKC